MISLCIISRKEDEKALQIALKSVYGFVDEILVIDTSTQEKIIINSEFKNVNQIPFKWTGSFADARNFSFEKAQGDVLFWIDSDDIVVNPENIQLLAKQITDKNVDWIYCEYIYAKDSSGNITAKHWKPRLFKKSTGTWIGNVHEDFIPNEVIIQKKDTELNSGTITIVHSATDLELKEHSKRNLEIQLAEIKRDGENVDPRTIQYTAMSYQGLGEYEKAIPYFMRHVKITGSKEDKYWSLYRISLCFLIVGRNEEALNFALDSLKYYPNWKTSYYLLAAIYNQLEQWDKVIEWTLVGLEKEDPDTLQVISELDYTILPLGRLSMAYLQTGNYSLANETAIDTYKLNSKYPGSKELVKMCMEAVTSEGFVKSFLEVVQNIKKYDRVKATELFNLVPKELDEDYRIQAARNLVVAPKKWDDKSIAIYCGRSLEEWSYPSIYSGIGGSEEAVINMSKELTALGYSVTVYNRCGDMKGEYDGVNYLPYYFFNKKDVFDTLIIWRNPLSFTEKFKAKRKYLWLHDIAHPEHFNKEIYDNIDKIFFLSKWHRTNLPDCPEEKVFITNNGINPRDFENLPEKKALSLVWSSSYDRGLLPFIKNILPLIKKELPEVTLDVAYGWQNIEKEMDMVPHLKKLYSELSPILENTEGITHHGRLSHKELANLLGSSWVYPYASEFGETNNITSQKCQAAGVFVVTTPQTGGTPERVKFGEIVKGSGIYTDKQQQKVFAERVISSLKKTQVNTQLIEEIKQQFSWSNTAKQWSKEIL